MNPAINPAQDNPAVATADTIAGIDAIKAIALATLLRIYIKIDSIASSKLKISRIYFFSIRNNFFSF
ncbi:MAG: hypothetical protein SPH93_12435 [Clostridium sp.]|uniref:hypothetical protein n=1 Tax=Clostridium sp. TaxID=1506 RepID=UPI002A915A02|nr:hypothetical protein [Clostridium sp.]MDY6228445.1 hypothetical protein [Clostridium sp.]